LHAPDAFFVTEAECGIDGKFVNAVAAELAKWIRSAVSGLPEGYQPAARYFGDFALIDVLGLKIAVEACTDVHAAVERCRARLEWPIDMCLAARRGAGAEQYVIVHHGGEVDLGAVGLGGLAEALHKRGVYRAVVKRDYVGEVATMLKAALSAASAPPHVLATSAQRIRDIAKVHGGGAAGWEEEEGEEE